MFVILFGLSMDYHVFILSRVKELVDGGMPTERGGRDRDQAHGGTVTSAAVVMVAVFAIFVSLRTLDIKQMGFGLAAAILIDATIVRARAAAGGDEAARRVELVPAALARVAAALRRRARAPGRGERARAAHRGARAARWSDCPRRGGQMKQEHRELGERLRAARGCWWSTTIRASAAARGRCSRRRGSTSSARRRTAPPRSRLAAELEPELVLLDMQLPDIDGFEVAARLLARDPDLQIVLVSSRDRRSTGR